MFVARPQKYTDSHYVFKKYRPPAIGQGFSVNQNTLREDFKFQTKNQYNNSNNRQQTISTNIKTHKNKSKPYLLFSKNQQIQTELFSINTGLQVRRLRQSTHQFTSNYRRDQILHFFDHKSEARRITNTSKIKSIQKNNNLDRSKYINNIQLKTESIEQTETNSQKRLVFTDPQSNLSGWGAHQSQQSTSNIYTAEDQCEVNDKPRIPSINLGFDSEQDSCSPMQNSAASLKMAVKSQARAVLQNQY